MAWSFRRTSTIRCRSSSRRKCGRRSARQMAAGSVGTFVSGVVPVERAQPMMADNAAPETPGSWSRRAVATVAGATALIGVTAGSILLTAAAASVRLLSVTTQGQAVVIEATEPVAYTVNRPDQLSLVVDLRNAAVADAITRVEPKGPVASLRLDQATAADGLGVARVRIALTRAAEYRIRSSRNTIRVEFTGGAAAKGAGAMPVAALVMPPPGVLPP